MFDLIMTIVFGMFGYWQFKNKKTAYGFIWLFTCGLCGIGWLIDIYSAYKAYKKPPAETPTEFLRLNTKSMTVHVYNCRLVNADMPRCHNYNEAKAKGFKPCRICMPDRK